MAPNNDVSVFGREIELAMRNASPRSYYVCRDEDLAHRTSFAMRIRVYDLQLIGETTYKALISNPKVKLMFGVAFDPAIAAWAAAEERARLGGVSEDGRLSAHEPQTETSNPGGMP